MNQQWLQGGLLTPTPQPESESYNDITKQRRGSLSEPGIRAKGREKEKNPFLSLLMEIKCMDYLLNGWLDLISWIKNTPKLSYH